MVHRMSTSKRYTALMILTPIANRLRALAKKRGETISKCLECVLGNEEYSSMDKANEPLVRTGQGDFETVIRPTDI
jgi:hypothetical protein